MDFKGLTAFQRPRKYTLDDFKGKATEEIAEMSYDYEYYKKQFKDLLDDEMLVLFDLIENADLSKKEVKIMGLMLRKMYEEKYKEVNQMIVLQCQEVRSSAFEKREDEVKIEAIEDIKEEVTNKVREIKEVEKEKEFTEKHHMGFFEIIQKMEELEMTEYEEEKEE